VPPAPIRVLRDYTRMRVDLTRDRTRNWQRLEKLLEDALIKVTSVASKLQTLSTRDMVEALIAGQRDPQALADLARGRLRGKHPALVQALTGRFDDHHGELARILLDQIDRLDTQIAQLTGRIAELVNDIDPAAPSTPPDSAADGSRPPATGALQRLSEIPGLSIETAQLIIAEIGLDMTRFPTAAHLVSWARLCPRTIQSGTSTSAGKIGKGNPYLKGVLGLAAATAARSGGTFLAERYRRIVKRRGKGKALVAVARSILVIIWHLLADPTARYTDLGPDYHDKRINTNRKINSLVRQLEALGHTVTLQPTT
jgi:transposase